MGNIQSKEGKSMGIWVIQAILILVVANATCQEDTDFITEVRPLVFPEPMMQASAAIDDIFGNESDHALFLSDGYWPNWLNNSTIA
jgi:hypothetical protein